MPRAVERSTQQKAAVGSRTPMRLFTGTAAMFLASLVVGLTLLSVVDARFNSSIDSVVSWSQKLRGFDDLGPHIQALAAPANRVSETQEQELGEADLLVARLAFDRQADLVARLISDASVDGQAQVHLGAQLDRLRDRAQEIEDLSEQSVQARSDGFASDAARSLASVSAATSDAMRTLNQAKADIYGIEHQALLRQRNFSNSVRVMGVAFALFGVLSMVALWVFGRRLARIQRVQSAERAANFRALQRSEAELRSYNRKLAESNRDLTDFAYVASHDLQEPLRKIMAFGDRLRSKYGAELGEAGGDYLSRMQNAAGRMQVLIEDLLTFSRVATRGEPFVVTDLNLVANGVLNDLEVAIERAGATIDLFDLPTISVDPSQFRQLVQNLVGNALKFRRMDVVPYVSIGARRLGESDAAPYELVQPSPAGWWQIDVKDNGIGFEQKYAEKIFTVFQRLHGRSDYEGSGVGLSVVRRIVERHQGTIAVTSQPGVGTTFHVVLPGSHPENKTIESAESSPNADDSIAIAAPDMTSTP